jgi:hypothetical protein
MTRLKNEETVIVDIGNVTGLTVRNMVEQEVRIYVDYEGSDGVWKPITSERKLAGGAVFQQRRTELEQDRVRVGVRGPDDGRDLVEVTP